MRESHRFVEADLDSRRAEQRSAVDVELTGDGHMILPKAKRSLPGEVRVDEQDAPAVLGDLLPQPPAVGAEIRLAGFGEHLEAGTLDDHIAGRFTRRLGVGHEAE